MHLSAWEHCDHDNIVLIISFRCKVLLEIFRSWQLRGCRFLVQRPHDDGNTTIQEQDNVTCLASNVIQGLPKEQLPINQTSDHRDMWRADRIKTKARRVYCKCCTLKRLVLRVFQRIPSFLLMNDASRIEVHTQHLLWVISPLCSHFPDGQGVFHRHSFHPSKGDPCISLYGFASTSSWAFGRVKINDFSCSHRSLAAAAMCFFSKSAYCAWFSYWSKVFISCWFKLLVKSQRNCHIHLLPGCSA